MLRSKPTYFTLEIKTHTEKFYSITSEVELKLQTILTENFSESSSGTLHLFLPHTSCALTISESFDPSAQKDMEEFLKHIAPTNLPFIQHTDEGPDDSPSHLKSILLGQSLTIFIEEKKLILGRWQGIYLCEFRRGNRTRTVMMKYVPDRP